MAVVLLGAAPCLPASALRSGESSSLLSFTRVAPASRWCIDSGSVDFHVCVCVHQPDKGQVIFHPGPSVSSSPPLHLRFFFFFFYLLCMSWLTHLSPPLQGFCVRGERQKHQDPEMSCFPLWHASQSHRHQPARDLLQGKGPGTEDTLSWLSIHQRNQCKALVQVKKIYIYITEKHLKAFLNY